MDKVNPDNNLLLSLKEKLQGFFATKDYVKAKAADVKSYIATHFATLLFAGVGIIVASLVAFILYLHNDAKQERQALKNEAKQEGAKANRERQELKQQISELKTLIESFLHGVNKGKPTASR